MNRHSQRMDLFGRMRMKSMNGSKDSKGCVSFSDAFYGTSTLGERGQVVIPAEARADMGLSPGDKLVVMRHPIHRGLMLFKIEAMREFLDDFSKGLAEMEGQVAKGDEETK